MKIIIEKIESLLPQYEPSKIELDFPLAIRKKDKKELIQEAIAALVDELAEIESEKF